MANKKVQNIHIIANTKCQNFKVETQQEGLGWKHNKNESVFTNTTSIP